jgi:hypothetical protein
MAGYESYGSPDIGVIVVFYHQMAHYLAGTPHPNLAGPKLVFQPRIHALDHSPGLIAILLRPPQLRCQFVREHLRQLRRFFRTASRSECLFLFSKRTKKEQHAQESHQGASNSVAKF